MSRTTYCPRCGLERVAVGPFGDCTRCAAPGFISDEHEASEKRKAWERAAQDAVVADYREAMEDIRSGEYDRRRQASSAATVTPQEEIAKLKHAISGLIPWVAGSGRGAAQEALADACELIGADPFIWSAHPDVLLRRRPDLERRADGRI